MFESTLPAPHLGAAHYQPVLWNIRNTGPFPLTIYCEQARIPAQLQVFLPGAQGNPRGIRWDGIAQFC